jgi:ribosomal protein L28
VLKRTILALHSGETMARKCDLTGQGTRFGNNVSHSHRKTRRTFKSNVHKKRIFLPEEGRFITLNVSTRALRTLQKKGLAAMMKDVQK